MTALLAVPRDGDRFSGVEPAVSASSPGLRRLFCGGSGSPIALDADHDPDAIHSVLVALDAPANSGPQVHLHHAGRLPWFETPDDPPRQSGFEGP